MPLLLTEAEVLELFPMERALECVEASFRAQHSGHGVNRSRERIFLPGQSNPVILKRNSNALFLLQRVRDEAHRFAIAYHKKLRSKESLHSALDRIAGIGAARKRNLLRTFGSMKAIEQASVDDLLKVPSMNEKVAQQIWQIFHSTLS